jgi:hypothetical protein
MTLVAHKLQRAIARQPVSTDDQLIIAKINNSLDTATKVNGIPLHTKTVTTNMHNSLQVLALEICRISTTLRATYISKYTTINALNPAVELKVDSWISHTDDSNKIEDRNSTAPSKIVKLISTEGNKVIKSANELLGIRRIVAMKMYALLITCTIKSVMWPSLGTELSDQTINIKINEAAA